MQGEAALVAAAHLLHTTEAGGEIVLAVLGPLGASARAALAHVADAAQAWAVVRADTPAQEARGRAHHQGAAPRRLAGVPGHARRTDRRLLAAPPGVGPVTGRLQRIPRGPRSALGSALCAAATCASLFALTGLIVRGGWLVATWLIVLVVAARRDRRARRDPVLVGAHARRHDRRRRHRPGPVRRHLPDASRSCPTATRSDRTLATAREGVAVINASLVPMVGVRPAELLVVVGAVAVFLLADLVAIGLGAPALSGLAFAGALGPRDHPRLPRERLVDRLDQPVLPAPARPERRARVGAQRPGAAGRRRRRLRRWRSSSPPSSPAPPSPRSPAGRP